jgi:predicted ATP-grasp superfamily ATP-dependent carboligase
VDATDGQLHAAPSQPTQVMGKAVVHAVAPCQVGRTDAWLSDPDVRDVPQSGTDVPPGAPICTVLAEAPDAERCTAALAARAAQLRVAQGAS